MIKLASVGLLFLVGCTANPLVGIQAVQDISRDEAQDLLGNPQITVVDVRSPGEYAQGHLKGAILIPTGEVREKASVLLPDRNHAILVTCGSGRRSKAASDLLNRLGYANIYNLSDGIGQWPYGLER